MTNLSKQSVPNAHSVSSHLHRLVLFVNAFPRRSETFIVYKFLGLIEQGWDVHIVCADNKGEDWHLFQGLVGRKNLQHRIHVIKPLRPKLLETVIFPFTLIRCLLFSPKTTLLYLRLGWKRFGPYILYLLNRDAEFILLQPALIHFEFGSLAIGRMHLKELLDCRITVSFRGKDISSTGLGQADFYRQVWEQADALHLVGEALWQQAIQRGCPSDKAHVLIPSAIDTTFFSRQTMKLPESVGIPDRPYRIISVGRLVWSKGYEYALQAVKLLVDRGISCEYHIIGEGNYLEAIEFTSLDLGLEDVVTLLGPRSRSEVKEQLEWADVFLHPAVSEGFCNTVLEAQAMFLPVVCTDAGALRENVANDETGFIVPRRDWRSMAEKLALLVGDSNLRSRMGEAGRHRVMAHFQLTTQTADISKFYSQVLI